MKAKEMGLIEGSGCYYCQTMFEPEDEVCFDANFRDYVRIMHLKCSKRNGRMLGFEQQKAIDEAHKKDAETRLKAEIVAKEKEIVEKKKLLGVQEQPAPAISISEPQPEEVKPDAI